MKEQFAKVTASVKEFWGKQSPKKKKIFIFSGVGVLLAALLITLFLNLQGNGYQVLYEGMESAEVSEAYSALQELGYSAELNKEGQIVVPDEQYDEILMAMAMKGFPKTTLTYDGYEQPNGLTATDFEKRQSLKFLREKQIKQTLEHIQGVQTALVLLNLPDESKHVWEQAGNETASASATLSMAPGVALSPERVSGIKTLISSSFENMLPENVKVVDASTGIEMLGVEEQDNDGYNVDRLDYERQIEQRMEENVHRLLSPTYGKDGVVAVATVELDYDKMITESFEQNPDEFSDDGKNAITQKEEKYTVNGSQPAGDIVGEENNTDDPTTGIPGYANQLPDEEGGMTSYESRIEYAQSYIKKQIEKGEPSLKSSSIAVSVDAYNLTEQRKADLVDQISRATGVQPGNVAVMQMDEDAPAPVVPEEPGEPAPSILANPIFYIVVGSVLLLIIIAVIVLVLVRKRQKKRLAEAEAESEMLINSLQAEIEERKRQIADAANADNDPSDNAIVQEIRNFAKENPEITASLIRSWLKEDQ